MPADIAAALHEAYAQLGAGPVAVRSSATAEDLPDASYAGQHDTFLDVEGYAAVQQAVLRCWSSLWTPRALVYRARQHLSPTQVSLAVVVQRMVRADCAGVAFTADPVTGARDRIVLNAVRGLGESLVSGAADPYVVTVEHDGGRVLDRRGEPVLDDGTAQRVAALARRVEQLTGRPMDVEWALADGEVALLQARPVTVTGFEEWNDSRTGDYLWTCANLAEAVPSVVKPLTWSMVQIS